MIKDRRARPYCFTTCSVKERGYETIPEALDDRMSLPFVSPALSMILCTADIMLLSTEAGNSTEECILSVVLSRRIRLHLSMRRGRSQVSSGTPTSTHPAHSNLSQYASSNISPCLMRCPLSALSEESKALFFFENPVQFTG